MPFFDLRPSHEPLRDALLADVAALLDSNAYTNGPAVGEFEAAFADWCGARRCVGVGSGLDGLRLSLLAAGIEPGDEVIVPALTFVATVEAVTQAGGVPIVVDVDERDLTISADAFEAARRPRTRFVIPVHLYGHMADLGRLRERAARGGIAVVEDACQAHGATRDGLTAGGGGLAGAFSFYPAKNLGAFGDAGAVVTGDDALADRVIALREHGQREKYRHEWEGYTARLDTIQALALLRKLPHLERWNDERRAAARYYSDALAGVGDLRLPVTAPRSEPVWHLYVIRTADPAQLAKSLHGRGVATGRHYPEPVHLTTAYERLGQGRGSAPVAEAAADEVLSLPLFPGITESQLERVVEGIVDFFRRG